MSPGEPSEISAARAYAKLFLCLLWMPAVLVVITRLNGIPRNVHRPLGAAPMLNLIVIPVRNLAGCCATPPAARVRYPAEPLAGMVRTGHPEGTHGMDAAAAQLPGPLQSLLAAWVGHQVRWRWAGGAVMVLLQGRG